MAEQKRGVHPTGGKEMTQQHMKAETDINNIVARYRQTRQLPPPRGRAAYGEFTATDFQQMQNGILEAQARFDALPAKIRRRFGNQPYHLLAYLDDPENTEEARALGLLPKEEAPPEPAKPEAAKAPEPAPKPDDEANPRKSPNPS